MRLMGSWLLLESQGHPSQPMTILQPAVCTQGLWLGRGPKALPGGHSNMFLPDPSLIEKMMYSGFQKEAIPSAPQMTAAV